MIIETRIVRKQVNRSEFIMEMSEKKRATRSERETVKKICAQSDS